MKIKRIVLISLFLLIILASFGSISASDTEEINTGEIAIDDATIDIGETSINEDIGEADSISENPDEGIDENIGTAADSQGDDEAMKGEKSSLQSSNLQSTITVDGSANNQMNNPTIQTAINNAKLGDTIIITGTSYVHCHFIVNKNLTIISKVGTKMSPCTSNTQGSGTYGIFYIGPEGSGTVIQGFTLTNLVQADDAYGILVRGASNVKISNCTINTTRYGDGIRLENTSNTVINNSTIKNSNIGINIVGSNKTTITNSYIYNNSKIGIQLLSANKTTINKNNISNNSRTGIYIGENNTNTTIDTNNITYNKNTGINLSSANYVYIINNLIGFNRNGDDHTSTAGAGVYINCNLTKVEIKGNFIRQNGLYGVLNDYRTRNMNADRFAELLEINTNNYYMGHSERLTYHIEYKRMNRGSFNYSEENDMYIYVGEGNGTYDVDKSVVYLGYAFFVSESICGATLYSAPSNTWGSGNYKLKVSEIRQDKKGVYSVSIVDNAGNIIKDISSIYVTFYLNKDNYNSTPQSGDIYRTVLMKNGTATADFTDADFKESGNTIIAVFPGLDESYNVNPYAAFSVNDDDIPGTYKQTKISVSNIKLVPKSGENFTAILTDENDKPLANENVTFTIGSSIYTVKTDSQGKAQLLINLAYSGTYTVKVNYFGSENYNKSSAKATITIKKQTPKIGSSNMAFIPYAGEYFKVTLKDENGKAIANKKVTFTIGSSTYTEKTDSQGEAKLLINLGYSGTYKITIKSPSTDQYNAVNKTNTLTIKSGSKKVKLTASNASFVPKSGQYYIATLKDENNNPLAGKNVTFTIGSNTYTDTTDSEGKAQLLINLAYIQNYSMTVRFGGDDIYSSASSKVTLTVAKGITKINAYDRTFINKSGLDFSATLVGYDGNPLANKEITFTIGSSTYKATTDENGVGKLTINIIYDKTFKIITKYAGDSQNSAVNKTNTLTIIKGEKTSFIDANLPNNEIQRIIDESPEDFTSKFLGTTYNDINLVINKSQNLTSDVNTVLNGKDGEAVLKINSDNVDISNLIINANSTSKEGNGIIINNSNNVNIENAIVKNTLDSSKIDDYNNGSTILPGTGISILNSSQVNLINNNVSSFESGIYAENSAELGMYENEITLSNYGIKYGFGNANTLIENNTIKDNIGWYTEDVPEGPRGYGIFLNNSAVNVTINQNNISNNYLGISIDANNSTGIVVTSNLIADNSLEGIRFNAGYDLAENAIEPNVTDNAIYRNAEGPSMMILGEMSANPEGIYGPGQWDEELRLKVNPNWYGVNDLRTWDYESGIVGVGTMCPRIKTTTIRFTEIISTEPGTYTINFYKNGELATNLATFDIYATLNRNSDKKAEAHFLVINGTGTFSFDDSSYLDSDNIIEISVGSLITPSFRIYNVIYSQNV